MRLVTLAAAAAAVLSLAACGQSSGTSGQSRGATSALSCRQQYHAWQYGPARAAGKEMITALKSLPTAASAGDLPRMTAELETAGTAASVLRAHPMPHCADPAGYYGTMMTMIIAAGDKAKSASMLGRDGLILAMLPLKTGLRVDRELAAELRRTVGQGF
jgi:hypothetical protein